MSETSFNDEDRALLQERLCHARDALDEAVYLFSSDPYLLQTANAEVLFYEKMSSVYANLSSVALEHDGLYERFVDRLRQAAIDLGSRPMAPDDDA